MSINNPNKFTRITPPDAVGSDRSASGNALRTVEASFMSNVLQHMTWQNVAQMFAKRGQIITNEDAQKILDAAIAKALQDGVPDANAEAMRRLYPQGKPLPSWVRQHFVPETTNGLVDGMHLPEGFQAMLEDLASPPNGGNLMGTLSKWFGFLRLQPQDVDAFRDLRIRGARWEIQGPPQPTVVNGKRVWVNPPIEYQPVTIQDLMNYQTSKSALAAKGQTLNVLDQAAVQQSISDGTDNILLKYVQNASQKRAIATAFKLGIGGLLGAGVAIGAGTIGTLDATMPSAPTPTSIQGALDNGSSSAFKVPLNGPDGSGSDAGSPLSRPNDSISSPSPSSAPGGVMPTPTPAPSLGTGGFLPSGYTPLPPGWQNTQPLPTDPQQIQQYNLQTDDWTNGRSGSSVTTRRTAEQAEGTSTLQSDPLQGQDLDSILAHVQQIFAQYGGVNETSSQEVLSWLKPMATSAQSYMGQVQAYVSQPPQEQQSTAAPATPSTPTTDAPEDPQQ